MHAQRRRRSFKVWERLWGRRGAGATRQQIVNDGVERLGSRGNVGDVREDGLRRRFVNTSHERRQLGEEVERTKVVQSRKSSWLLERSWMFRLYFTR